ncbi:CPBP family intramembrane glutamic endopeptidase [Veronia pacifica]|uniref:Intracellular septation protein n=1 Tax=Veronia pacifica TaxID=1080227 RepID=A0A1C3EKZ4_9GAMM|nr:CPBP family intramembrane glutamic endopeptidase [Veronia pacifica]ODA33902.1 intracellular septation protein [Veronia pacifica]
MKIDNLRWVEFFSLFLILPIAAYVFRERLHPVLLPLLCFVATICFYIIYRDKKFKRFRLTNYGSLKTMLWRSPVLFIAGGTIIWFLSDVWLNTVPVSDISKLLFLIIIYPIFSVIPQEVIFRTYLFHRYKHQFPSKTIRIIVSASAFALSHIIYANWIAVIFSFFGGLIFAYTYAASRSTAACVIEHSIWGIWLFILGFGQYLDLSKTI